MSFILGQGPSKVNVDVLKGRIEQDIRAHRGGYYFQGIVFLVFGFIAAILPGVTALTAEMFVGVLLLFTGLFQLVTSFYSRMHWWAFFSAALSIVVGGWMLWMPAEGLVALVMATALFLTIEGIFEILLAFEFRFVRQWGWMAFSGVVSLILAALLWVGMPVLSILYLGIIIAVNFIFYGISILMLAASVRNSP